ALFWGPEEGDLPNWDPTEKGGQVLQQVGGVVLAGVAAGICGERDVEGNENGSFATQRMHALISKSHARGGMTERLPDHTFVTKGQTPCSQVDTPASLFFSWLLPNAVNKAF
ncbi:hypothetical protein CEXT_11291, partial [Caerostris extrusa]